jgi:hypothetical protein
MSNKTGTMTSVGDTVVMNGAGELTAFVSIYGTFSAAQFTFDVSPDGTHWYPIPAYRTSTAAMVTSSGSVSANAAWLVPINGFRFRTTLTAISSGTVNVQMNSNMVPLAANLPPGSSISAITAGSSADIGATTDAAVQGDANGSMIGFLRGISVAQYGQFFTVSSTPTVSASAAYTSGDNVGGKNALAAVTLVSGGSAKLQSITVTDTANQKAAMTILLFDSNPAAGVFTDNAATQLSTDLTKIVASIPLAGADFVTIDSKAVATLNGLNRAIKSAAQSFYYALNTTGTPTYAAVTDLKLVFGFER